jgi:hypothetical protein
MDIEKTQELTETGGQAEVLDLWTLVLVDGQSRDVIKISFTRDTRDELVRKLTDGIILAGGGFPLGGPHLADGSLGHGTPPAA